MIKEFKKENRFLSNFYITNIYFGGFNWISTEHIYQAYKSTNKDDFDFIRVSKTPSEAKKIGRNIEVDKNFDYFKNHLMWMCNIAKFTQNIDLRNKLLSTKGVQLIEGNYWHDNYWGDCYCDKCKDIQGQNILGKILIRIRNEVL